MRKTECEMDRWFGVTSALMQLLDQTVMDLSIHQSILKARDHWQRCEGEETGHPGGSHNTNTAPLRWREPWGGSGVWLKCLLDALLWKSSRARDSELYIYNYINNRISQVAWESPRISWKHCRGDGCEEFLILPAATTTQPRDKLIIIERWGLAGWGCSQGCFS